ncbi:MAG: pyridoxal-dependent decarboxylase [Pseudomonadota bacterium]
MLGALKYYLKQGLKQGLRRASDTFASRTARQLPPGYWGLAAHPQRGLTLGNVALHELLERHGSPLLVLDIQALKRNARQFVGDGTGGGLEVFYSYKTNPVAFSLSTLHQQGVGAEVISAYELWLALRLGVPADRIVYNGPVKSEASMRDAIARDIGLITANHAEELDGLARIAAEMGKRPRTGIRVSMSQGWSGQFGVPAGEALQAFSRARSLASLDVRALHAHRGGMIGSEAELTALVTEVLGLSDLLADRLGIELSILDFGGSLGTPSVGYPTATQRRLNRTLLRDLPAPDVTAALGIERYVSILTMMVGEHFARVSRPRPRIFVEPGRSMTSNTQLLLTTVHALKGAGDRTYAIMDGGINIAEPTRGEYHQLLAVNRINEPPSRVYTVVGPICTPADTLYPAARLPELSVGDSLCIMDAGAYFVPFATSFSYPQPAIVALDGDREILVRRAEQFEDMAARDIVRV